MEHDEENLAATLAREMKAPMEIALDLDASIRRVALPPGWSIQCYDDQQFDKAPRRKIASILLSDAASFVSYVKRHGSLGSSTVWCKADYAGGHIKFLAIINDHGEAVDAQNWRDHRAVFCPAFSEEWKRWISHNAKPFTQYDFASFMEENNKDLASVSGSATGAQMLEMAIAMETKQEVRFKSAIRLQNGGVSLNYVADDDHQTITRMQLFERFTLGMPVFLGGDAYQVDARLRYRVRDGKLTFWYELIRPDKLLEAATSTMVNTIHDQVGMPFYFGEA
jgi:uncharacterized protein YfdQ (DUF2303 family)